MSTDVAIRQGAGIEAYHRWTPEALQEAINREKELRKVVITYYREAMIESHHYYRLDDDKTKKPALSKEGALNLCSLFRVRQQFDTPAETYHPDGHYTVRYRVNLVDQNGEIVAQGDGLCSTRESKYAYRWAYESDIPVDVDKSRLVQTERASKSGGTYIRYKLPNPDLPDVWNTCMKMAEKRALVDGVLKLPLASELFTQDLEEKIQERAQEKRARAGDGEKKIKSTSATTDQQQLAHPSPDQIINLIELATSAGVELEDFGHDMRTLLATDAKITRKFLRETMSLEHLAQAQAQYEQRIKAEVETALDDDAEDTAHAEEPIEVPHKEMVAKGEMSQDGGEDEPAPQSPSVGVATTWQMATLKQLAKDVGEHAYASVLDTEEHYPHGIPSDVYDTAYKHIETQKAQKATMFALPNGELHDPRSTTPPRTAHR